MADPIDLSVVEEERRRRRWPWLAAAALIGVVSVVVVWFQPQKLFIDDRVDEPAPAEVATPSTAPAAAATTPVPDTGLPPNVASGTFVSIDHETTGRVRILETAGGQRVVRLEGLDTSNGPDLYLYLSTNPASGDEAAFDDEFVNLGRLKGNLGDQNYDLPADTDLARYRSVVIWCDRFNSAFGAADLVPA